MAEKKAPQSFALVLAESDGGLLNKQLSEAWQDLSDVLDADSFLHEHEAKGEFAVTFKVTNDRGKVLIVPSKVAVKTPPKKYTGARFYRTQEGDLTTKDPRAVDDLFAERRAEVQAKGAKVPGKAG